MGPRAGFLDDLAPYDRGGLRGRRSDRQRETSESLARRTRRPALPGRLPGAHRGGAGCLRLRRRGRGDLVEARASPSACLRKRRHTGLDRGPDRQLGGDQGGGTCSGGQGQRRIARSLRRNSAAASRPRSVRQGCRSNRTPGRDRARKPDRKRARCPCQRNRRFPADPRRSRAGARRGGGAARFRGRGADAPSTGDTGRAGDSDHARRVADGCTRGCGWLVCSASIPSRRCVAATTRRWRPRAAMCIKPASRSTDRSGHTAADPTPLGSRGGDGHEFRSRELGRSDASGWRAGSRTTCARSCRSRRSRSASCSRLRRSWPPSGSFRSSTRMRASWP